MLQPKIKFLLKSVVNLFRATIKLSHNLSGSLELKIKDFLFCWRPGQLLDASKVAVA